MIFLLCASLIHSANINLCSFTEPQAILIVLCSLPCLTSIIIINKKSTVERMKCNYSLSWPGLELCSRGYRAVLDLNLRLFCVGKTLPRLFLRDFISYAGCAQGLLRGRFGCRCVHFKSCSCHVLTKLLWNSVGLTAWADAKGIKTDNLHLPVWSILKEGWVWGIEWFYTVASGARGGVKKWLVQCHQATLQYILYILWLDMKIYSKLPEYRHFSSTLFKSF